MGTDRGIGLIEGVVAVAIVGTAFVALVGAFHLFLRAGLRTTPALKGLFLLEEGLEAVRSVRDRGWQTDITPLPLNTAHYLTFSGSQWTLATTPAPYVDGTYDRSVILAPVSRDGDGRIVSSGGTPDDGTRQVTVNISWWSGNATTTKTASLYITDLFTE